MNVCLVGLHQPWIILCLNSCGRYYRYVRINERMVFYAMVVHCKAKLGRRQPGRAMLLAQDRSIDLLASTPLRHHCTTDSSIMCLNISVKTLMTPVLCFRSLYLNCFDYDHHNKRCSIPHTLTFSQFCAVVNPVCKNLLQYIIIKVTIFSSSNSDYELSVKS